MVAIASDFWDEAHVREERDMDDSDPTKISHKNESNAQRNV